MKNPKELFYTKSHEWVKFIDETTVLVGITDYAQTSLGDIVFVNLPDEGLEISIGDSFSDVESVKAVSDIYSPVSGIIESVNQEIMDAPEMVNESPYDAWFVQIKDVSEKEELLMPDEYEQFLSEEE